METWHGRFYLSDYSISYFIVESRKYARLIRVWGCASYLDVCIPIVVQTWFELRSQKNLNNSTTVGQKPVNTFSFGNLAC